MGAPAPAEEAAPADQVAPADEVAPAAPESIPAEAAATEHDPARRAFFFSFGRQAVTAAGQVAGMADLVGRASGGGIAGLLGLDAPVSPPARPGFARAGQRAPVSGAVATAGDVSPAADDAFRSPYRLRGDELLLLDQRSIPERLDEVVARRGSDVAYYLRLGVARGGPLMAQVAAYGVALTAGERAGRPVEERRAELERTMRGLSGARPSARLLAWSVERMRAITAGLEPLADGPEVATALRLEADAIASDLRTWNAAVAVLLSERLAGDGERLAGDGDGPLVLLLHGVHGALAGGIVGSGLAALQRLREQGRTLRIFVTEGRPFMDGARLAAWELRQAGIDHQIIPDSAVAWLLDRERIDAVLIGGEWIAANGDIGALVGSRAIAQLAATSGTPVIVTAVSACMDPSTADGAAIPDELRPTRDLVAYLADVPVRVSDALVPASDVMPAVTVSTLLTEHGVVTLGGPA